MKPTSDPVVADNSEFFDSLFYGHQKALHAYLIGQTGDPDNAEDLLQQVFVRVWQHIQVAKQKPTEGLRYWLFAIASNIVIDFRRKQGRNQIFHRRLLDELAHSTKHVEEVAAERDSVSRIARAIQNLPEELRTPFTMTVLGEMNSEEVGKVLGKPAGTIRYQISEARKRISQEVGI